MAFPGGKGKTYQHIINLMPPHQIYIEPFLGGASVVKNKKPALKTIVADMDQKSIFNLGAEIPNLQTQKTDALDLLKTHVLCKKTLVYCDPPYVQTTRKKQKIYRYEYSNKQHENLLTYLTKQSCMVIMSGYDNQLYNDILTGWNKSQFQAQTQAGTRTETVWYNYPAPQKLHDSRYLGNNFRDRQNIKRRQERLRNKIENMHATERNILIEWLISNYVA